MGMCRASFRYLVAGGAGFVGSNLALKLLDHGGIVDVVDNLSTGRIENITELEKRPNFRFIELDITDARSCTLALERRYTHIYNLACPTGVPNIALLGEEMLTTCSVGVHNLLKVAHQSGAKYVYASTAEAYGDPEIFPQPETYVGNVDPVGPRSPYEEGKRFGEALTRYYGHKHGVDVNIVRIFNTYGPRMSPRDQRVIPQMLGSLIEGRPVTIFGDGTQTRTFLHVDDLVAGLMKVMDKGLPGEVYNIGGSTQIAIRELFEVVKSATGLRGSAVFRKHFICDHRGRWPQTSKMQSLGWQQKVSLEDGIRQSYDDLLSEANRERARKRGVTLSTLKAPHSAMLAIEPGKQGRAEA